MSLSRRLQLTRLRILAVLQPRRARSPVWPLPLSLATTYGITVVFFSSAYLDVSVRQVRDLLSPCLQHGRLPHSDTDGSLVVCTSPSLFAAYHVLRRLREPRHPPCALAPLPYLSCAVRTSALLSCALLILQLTLASVLCEKYARLLVAFLIPSLVNELLLSKSVENIGLEPMTPSLQS